VVGEDRINRANRAGLLEPDHSGVGGVEAPHNARCALRPTSAGRRAPRPDPTSEHLERILRLVDSPAEDMDVHVGGLLPGTRSIVEEAAQSGGPVLAGEGSTQFSEPCRVRHDLLGVQSCRTCHMPERQDENVRSDQRHARPDDTYAIGPPEFLISLHSGDAAVAVGRIAIRTLRLGRLCRRERPAQPAIQILLLCRRHRRRTLVHGHGRHPYRHDSLDATSAEDVDRGLNPLRRRLTDAAAVRDPRAGEAHSVSLAPQNGSKTGLDRPIDMEKVGSDLRCQLVAQGLAVEAYRHMRFGEGVRGSKDPPVLGLQEHRLSTTACGCVWDHPHPVLPHEMTCSDVESVDVVEVPGVLVADDRENRGWSLCWCDVPAG
jgi:hypothetical protein